MESNFIKMNSISHKDIENEWDVLSLERHNQINSGKDITFKYFMVPLVKRLVANEFDSTLIDIGSGTGEMTLELAGLFKNIISIEPSFKSINIAKKNSPSDKNIIFINKRFEDCLDDILGVPSERKTFLAAMMLSADPSLDYFSETISKVSSVGDIFVATIPHPCFWPRYWGYENESWFSYKDEIIIKAPFKISLSKTSMETTHIHRPIEKYISILSSHGFNLVEMSEPYPSKDVQLLYPKPWDFPRFLAFKWVKV